MPKQNTNPLPGRSLEFKLQLAPLAVTFQLAVHKLQAAGSRLAAATGASLKSASFVGIYRDRTQPKLAALTALVVLVGVSIGTGPLNVGRFRVLASRPAGPSGLAGSAGGAFAAPDPVSGNPGQLKPLPSF